MITPASSARTPDSCCRFVSRGEKSRGPLDGNDDLQTEKAMKTSIALEILDVWQASSSVTSGEALGTAL